MWIAFKLYFYWVLWQRNCGICCGYIVVNCFQIVFLLGSLTTFNPNANPIPELWIAFKLYFYWVLWQLSVLLLLYLYCCELLSNCIFTGFFDNSNAQTQRTYLVVNCFQIVFLLGSLTTIVVVCMVFVVLWIAFKLYFYWVLWQLAVIHPSVKDCCELLSNCIFTGFFDNAFSVLDIYYTVVNCFQIVFLLGSLTTVVRYGYGVDPLWIAFKLYFYWVLWQRNSYLVSLSKPAILWQSID